MVRPSWFRPYRKRHTEMQLSAKLMLALCALGHYSQTVANEAAIRVPPLADQIDLGRQGVATKFDVEIDRHLVYNFAIRFRYPQGDLAERGRIRAIIGGPYLDRSGSPLEPGVPTPIRLTIFRQPNKEPFYQKAITPILTSWGGDSYAKGYDSFTKTIGHCDLPPGTYTIVVESLAQSEQYTSIPTFFLVGMDLFKISFDPKRVDRSKTCPM